MKKYELTSETKTTNGVVLYRIKALKDFSNVKKGDWGGLIAKVSNLSQDGDARVYDNARVYGDARVYVDARINKRIHLSNGTHSHMPYYIDGSKYPVHIDGNNGLIRSGCVCRTIEWWDKNMEYCAKENGYTDEQIQEYKVHFENIKDWIAKNGIVQG